MIYDVYMPGDDEVNEWENRAEHYKSVSTADLVSIAEDGGFVEDIPAVLRELLLRDSTRSLHLAKSILENEKGDKFLWDWVREFLDDNFSGHGY